MKKIILGIIGGLIIVVIAGGVWLYTGKFNSSKAKAFEKLSLPVAVAGSKTVSGKEFMSRLHLAEILYKGDKTYDATATENQILDELIDSTKLQQIAAAHKVTVSSKDINDEYQGIVGQFAGGDESKFKDILSQTYQLSIDEFKNKVIMPDALKTNLTIWYDGQKDLNKAQFAQAQTLLDKLAAGQPFEDMVKAYTQDPATKDLGGDVGSVKLSQLSPEFQGPISSAKAGDQLTIISRFGIHIVKVVDINKTGDEATYHLQQVYIKEDGFQAWYSQQADAIKTHKLLKF